MRLRSLPLLVMALVMTGGLCQLAWAQSPTYGLGKTPTAEEIRDWDIAISPDGKELPPGGGTARKVRASMPRSVRHATVQQGREAGLLS
jgi:hypothetical protein